jgi:hypothetical protein
MGHDKGASLYSFLNWNYFNQILVLSGLDASFSKIVMVREEKRHRSQM